MSRLSDATEIIESLQPQDDSKNPAEIHPVQEGSEVVLETGHSSPVGRLYDSTLELYDSRYAQRIDEKDLDYEVKIV